MSITRKTVAFVTPIVLAAGALSVAAALPSASAGDPIECDADYVSLVVQNGQNQYFVCDDTTAGEIRQTFSSKNPWILDPASPALFTAPTAGPQGAVGQVFTGSTQGVGVISSSDLTGNERDSISRDETLTLIREQTSGRNFGGLELAVRVLQNETQIRVQPVDENGSDVGNPVEVQKDTGSYDIPFFIETPVQAPGAAGFKISASAGEFSLAGGKQSTRFYFTDITPPDQVDNLNAEVTFPSVTLTWTNPTDEDLTAVIVDGNGSTTTLGAGETSFTDGPLEPDTEYTYSVVTEDDSGNQSDPVTTTFTTPVVFENGGDTSPVISFEDSSVQAQFDGGELDCPVSADNPLPYELTIGDPADFGGSVDATVGFDLTVDGGTRDISGCRFTLEVFSETTEIRTLFFDPDGPGDIFTEPVEQELCVEGVSPTVGSEIGGSPNLNVSCLESMTLANNITGDVAQDRDGQLFLLTGYFDARGFLR